VKLHQTTNAGLQLFTGYGAGYVAVNTVRHETSVLVTPEQVTEWNVAAFEALTGADFGFIADLKPEIVIFGTGAVQRFPRPELARALAAMRTGVEVMDTRLRRPQGDRGRPGPGLSLGPPHPSLRFRRRSSASHTAHSSAGSGGVK
jgi:uncharacterized protein